MHRHGYKGRKFGRKTDQRRALMRGMICSLIQYQEITVTLARAKEIRRETEKLITRAKKGGLANRRILISRLGDLDTANLLVDVIAPQITHDSGYLRIERNGFRKGDHAEMAIISFVDDINLDITPETKPAEPKTPQPKSSQTKSTTKSTDSQSGTKTNGSKKEAK